MLSIKSKFSDIEREILSIHPYEIPEILSIDIKDINDKYFSWIKNYSLLKERVPDK